MSITYPTLVLQPLPAASSGTETVTLNGTAPTGFTLKFFTTSVKLTTDAKVAVGMTINASQSVTTGDYKLTAVAKYGTSMKTFDFTVRVVQYLIFLSQNSFSPNGLTVKSGSTVFWINLDYPAGVDPEIHNVIFTSGTTAHSGDMANGNSYSFTFTAPGTYAYYCSYHPPGMKGTVTVTA